jgi:hypothetical protein
MLARLIGRALNTQVCGGLQLTDAKKKLLKSKKVDSRSNFPTRIGEHIDYLDIGRTLKLTNCIGRSLQKNLLGVIEVAILWTYLWTYFLTRQHQGATPLYDKLRSTDPDVRVRKVLTPGVLRRRWQGILGGVHEAPHRGVADRVWLCTVFLNDQVPSTS